MSMKDAASIIYKLQKHITSCVVSNLSEKYRKKGHEVKFDGGGSPIIVFDKFTLCTGNKTYTVRFTDGSEYHTNQLFKELDKLHSEIMNFSII